MKLLNAAKQVLCDIEMLEEVAIVGVQKKNWFFRYITLWGSYLYYWQVAVGNSTFSGRTGSADTHLQTVPCLQ